LDVVWPKVCGKVNTWPYINEITQQAKEIRHITTYHRSWATSSPSKKTSIFYCFNIKNHHQ
jgi:hypothetical protein